MTVDYATANGTAPRAGRLHRGHGTLTFAAGQTRKPSRSASTATRSTRPTRPTSSTSRTPVERDDHRRPGPRNDHRRRPATGAVDRRRHRAEGDPGTARATFTVTPQRGERTTVTVDYATANSTATAPADYTARPANLTFAAGETTKTVTVTVNGDELDEVNETFNVNLTSPRRTRRSPTPRVGTITDDDGRRRSRSTTSRSPRATRHGRRNLHRQPDRAERATVTVDYATADGTAIAPGDYEAANGHGDVHTRANRRRRHGPGQRRPIDEIDETYSSTSRMRRTRRSGRPGNRHDHRQRPPAGLSVNDVTVTEGHSGTVNANVHGQPSAPSGQVVSVDYATADGRRRRRRLHRGRAASSPSAPALRRSQRSVQVKGDPSTRRTKRSSSTSPTRRTRRSRRTRDSARSRTTTGRRRSR